MFALSSLNTCCILSILLQRDLETGVCWDKCHKANQLITNWHTVCCQYPTQQQLLHHLHLRSNIGGHLSAWLFSGATSCPHNDHHIQETASENVDVCVKGTNVCPQHHEDRCVSYKCSSSMPMLSCEGVCVVTLFALCFHF